MDEAEAGAAADLAVMTPAAVEAEASAVLAEAIRAEAAHPAAGKYIMEDKLQELVDRLKHAERERLQSVILYGSAAAGEHNEHFSDLNVLCVLTRVTPAELADAEPIFKWWRAQGNPSPLLLSEEELRTSTDCFPIEFHDMQERRRVLFGTDPIQDLVIEKSFYRAQVEMELQGQAFAPAAESGRGPARKTRAAAPDDRFGAEFPGAGAARAAAFRDCRPDGASARSSAICRISARTERHSISCSTCATKAN